MIHSRLGSLAAAITRWISGSGTNSSRVEWIAASGSGLTRSTSAAVLNVGSFGTPCVT
jgi:hypothetical protein